MRKNSTKKQGNETIFAKFVTKCFFYRFALFYLMFFVSHSSGMRSLFAHFFDLSRICIPCTILQIQPTRMNIRRNWRMPKRRAVMLNLSPTQAEIMVPIPEVKGIQFRIRHTSAVSLGRATTAALQVDATSACCDALILI